VWGWGDSRDSLETMARSDLAVKYIFEAEDLSVDSAKVEANLQVILEELTAPEDAEQLQQIRTIFEERAKVC
jgi:hypothetical protein